MPLARLALEPLAFQVYGRPLHPELFEIAATETVARADFQAIVRITRSGHVVTWAPRCGPPFHLTEVVDAEESHLPDRQLYRGRFGPERQLDLRPRPGVRYQACFQAELLPPDLFLRANDDLLRGAKRRGFVHYFPPTSPYGPPPLGFVSMDGRHGCQVVYAFHTYPDEGLIVKSQSVFETVG